MLYAFHENFILPLSHDEVVHGKGSLLSNMPGDYWQKFANLRLLFGYMFGQPGKKLLFMGGEFGQWNEWYHEVSLDWHLLEYPSHAGVQRWLADLNRVYREQPALHEVDFDWTGFEWIDCNDVDASILTFLRRGQTAGRCGPGGLQFYAGAPPQLSGRRPHGGFWQELLNSDAQEYGGSGLGNAGGLDAESWPHHGRPFSLNLTLPPLATVFLKPSF